MAAGHKSFDKPKKNKEFTCPVGVCPNCGKEYRGWGLAKQNIKDEDKFCEVCGTELEISSPDDNH